MDGAMIKIGGLYKKHRQKDGREYLTGRFGFGARLLVLPNDRKTADSPPNEPDYCIFVVPIEDNPKPGPPERTRTA
jgi:hypothetical protein